MSWSLGQKGLSYSLAVECHVNSMKTRFLCASYRSLLMLSSLEVVRLCDVLFLFTAKIIPTSKYESYLLQCFRTHHFQNPYMFSSKLGRRIMEGLNVTHLIHLVCTNLRFLISSSIQCAPNGIGVILAGRIKGDMKTRFLAWVALCVRLGVCIYKSSKNNRNIFNVRCVIS